MTDDQEHKTIAHFNGKVLTPHIDQLAKNGMVFSRAYVSSTVCSPARYTALTGRHASKSDDPEFLKRYPVDKPHRIGNYCVLSKNKMQNIAGILQANGYVTGMVGKNHLSDHDLHEPGNWKKAGLKKYDQEDDPKKPEINKKMKYNHDFFYNRFKKYGFDHVLEGTN